MITFEYSLPLSILLVSTAVLLIGVSKAGFGGGTGLLTTPLMALVFPAKIVVGFMLPMLIIGDWFTIYNYKFEWDKKNIYTMVPGAIVGILLGTFYVDTISDHQLKKFIGIVALLFLIIQILRLQFKIHQKFQPNWWMGTTAGGIAGFVSAVAHSAGVVAAMYMLPQEMEKRKYVATMTLFFTIVNLIKVPGYVSINLITFETLKFNLYFLPLIPIGVWLGLQLNKRISQKTFMNVIYVIVFITAVQLLSGFNIFDILNK